MADSLVQSVYYLYSLVLAGVFVTYFPASVRTSVIMPLEETFQNPSNLLYTLRQLKNDLIYKLTEL